MTDPSGYAKTLALPAGFDAPRHAVAPVNLRRRHSIPSGDLGLTRQRVGVEPEVGMRFRTLRSYRSALRDEARASALADSLRPLLRHGCGSAGIGRVDGGRRRA
jgi:hypothetical protein